MDSFTHLHFNTSIGSKKPESIRNKETACPFCNKADLEDIIDIQGSIILLKNKYPVLEDTHQTVLIETDICDAELSLYHKDHLHTLFDFGVTHWFKMIESNEFRSVIFFKNHGPLSGGTIRHPHMQIVGLNNYDYLQNLKGYEFEGITIVENKEVLFNISTKPRMGFYEFNVILKNLHSIHVLADYVQIAAHYVLNGFHKYCSSYNLFFYQLGQQIAVKIVPRFAASPLYVGYAIPLVANNLEQKAKEIEEQYLNNPAFFT
jgi:ATP adenylyltransferase/5',5'''-P-1,P-4-tetraphosphate phosphorylase II